MIFGRNNKNMWYDIYIGNWCQKLYDLKVVYMFRESLIYIKDFNLV